jgi:hypothetical protein
MKESRELPDPVRLDPGRGGRLCPQADQGRRAGPGHPGGGAGQSLLDPAVTTGVLDRLGMHKHLLRDEKLARHTTLPGG